MQHYEILIIISSKITEEELPFVIDKIVNLIKKNGGEITKDENLGKKKLAFPIKQSRYGFYLLLEFNLPPENLQTIEKEFRLMEEVIRHQTLKSKIKTEKELEKEKRMKERKEVEIFRGKKISPISPAPIREISLAKEADLKKEKETAAKPFKKKISLEELDEKLDKILDDDMIK